TAIEAAAPAAGLDFSADGLRRLARTLAPGYPGDPLEYTDAPDAKLQELFRIRDPDGPPRRLRREPPTAPRPWLDSPPPPPPLPAGLARAPPRARGRRRRVARPLGAARPVGPHGERARFLSGDSRPPPHARRRTIVRRRSHRRALRRPLPRSGENSRLAGELL